MTTTFDREAFYTAVDAVRKQRGVSWNCILRATGVTACHIPSRMRRHTLTAPNRQRLAAWAGLDAGDFERKEVVQA